MPNVTRLDLDLGNGWRTIVFDSNVPVDEKTTRTCFIALRNFFTGSWADWDARRRVMKIFREDQKTVEAQRPELLPYDLAAELHIKSDAMGVAYRRLRKRYLDMGWGVGAQTSRPALVIASPRGEERKRRQA
jgi:phenylpropionate dioxygenase-like ring-hydroxylating dioxygenase large terminal subunit